MTPQVEITLRRATEADAKVAAELSEQLGYPITAEAMRRRIVTILANPEHDVIIAQRRAQVCGWVHVHVQQLLEAEPRGEILGLVVSRDLRRAGLGRLLMDEAERWVRDRGLDLMVLRSNVQRPESHAFYPAIGYEHFKTQAAYRKRLR